MEKVKVQITDNKPCEVNMALEIDAHLVNKESDSVFNAILQQAKIPGFRQGKAPMEIIRKTYHETARQKVMENLIARVIPEVLKEHKLQAISLPRIEKYDFDFDKSFSLQLKIEKQPEVKVKDYKKIKLIKKEYPVNDQLIDQQITQLREHNARLAAGEDTPAEKEHFVVVDYSGFMDGKRIPGSEAKNQMINLSASHLIQGLAEGIIGARTGEERSITIQFPGEYPKKEYAGKSAVFKVMVKEIKKKILPALDEEFAKDVGFPSLAELTERIKQDLESQAVQRSEKEIRDQICDHLLNVHNFPVPVSLVEEHAETLLERTHRLFLQQGYPAQAWEKQKQASREKIMPEAEKQLRLSYILSAVGRAENIQATDDDLDQDRKKMAESNPDKVKAVEEYFRKHRDELISRIKEEKIFKFLLDNAKIRIEK